MRGLDRLGRAMVNRRLMRLARRLRPQLLLVVQGNVLTAATLSTARRETGCVTANWWPGDSQDADDRLTAATSGAYDLFYVSGTGAERRHHSARATVTRWLPLACDPPTSRAGAGSAESSPRVAFVGAASRRRRGLLARLVDLDLGIWGPGWDTFANDPEIGSAIRGGMRQRSEWEAVYASTDVVLNLARHGEGQEVYASMANLRTFEALACGACQVMDARRDALILFRDHEHLVSFRSPDEIRDVVIDLLGDPERRRALGEAGLREAHSRHTWRQRAIEILRDLESLTTARAVEAAS
jgi:glycosyltransferase involved in cell wall biosynthesis